MDGIELPFENVLDYSKFSIRISEENVPAFVEVLQGIPTADIARLRAGLDHVRSRFGYSSLAHNERRLAATMAKEMGAAPPHEYLASLARHNAMHEDALQTLLRVLLYRAASRR